MINIVCFIWDDPSLNRPYLPEYVDVLASMFERNLSVEHRVTCISNNPQEAFSHKNIIALPEPEDVKRLSSFVTPEGGRFPTCYRRLWIFSEEAKSVLGERIFLTDVDTVLTGDVTSLVSCDGAFVGWCPKIPWGRIRQRIAGGLYMMNTGEFADVYNDFDLQGIADARKAGYRGSDQAWISYKLAGRVKFWDDKKEGLLSIRDFRPERLPKGARLVTFNGPKKPWDCLSIPWVKEHWR